MLSKAKSPLKRASLTALGYLAHGVLVRPRVFNKAISGRTLSAGCLDAVDAREKSDTTDAPLFRLFIQILPEARLHRYPGCYSFFSKYLHT